MTDLTDGWQARILDTPDGFMRDLRTVIVFRREGDDLVALSGWTDAESGFAAAGTPILTRWPAHTVSPDDVRILMPIGALEAIAEAVKPGPSQGEMRAVADALDLERSRVDGFLTELRLIVGRGNG